MSRNWFPYGLTCAWLFVAALLPSAGLAAERPNIVIVLADDYGYGDPGCYNPQAKIPSPSIDRLAREGIRCTDSHSGSAVCSPTRYGLLTGRYAWRTRLKRGVLVPYDPPLIEADRLTLPALLKQQGYHTACIGKWHLGWNWPTKDGAPDFTQPIADGPTTRGFDEYFGTDVPNYPPYCFIQNDRTLGLPTAEKTMRDLDGRPGPMLPGWKFDEILPTLAQRATEYIARRASTKEPFFLYLPLTSPHEPIHPSAKFRGKTGIAPIADFLLETDAVLGDVLAALDKHQVAENTLVIFTADNGHAKYTGLELLQKAGHEPSGPLRGYKTDIYEGGHRVPFVARWPGRIKPGTTSAETMCHTDLLATIASLVGAQLPAGAGEDSYDVSPALLGAAHQPIREATVHHSVTGLFAIRQGPWKLIPRQTPPAAAGKQADATAGELYHLGDDLGEKQNQYDRQPDVVARLTALLKKYQDEGRSR